MKGPTAARAGRLNEYRILGRLIETGVTQQSELQRYAVDFSVDGDVKYLAHQDSIRMFARALVRAELPVKYSEGFNPHPRIALPLPRPVGIASDSERLVVTLTQTGDVHDFKRRLQRQMPRGVRIRSVRILDPADRCLPARAKYRVVPSAMDVAEIRAAADRAMRCGPIHVERRTGEKSPPKRVDVRPFIERIDVTAEAVDMVLAVTAEGTARPAEICGLLGLGSDAVNHLIRRIEIQWQ